MRKNGNMEFKVNDGESAQLNLSIRATVGKFLVESLNFNCVSNQAIACVLFLIMIAVLRIPRGAIPKPKIR